MTLIDDAISYAQTIRIDGIQHPEYFFALIPLFIVLFLLLRKDFVKLKEEENTRKRRRRFQWFVLITRTLIAALLITALAIPFATQEQFIEGDPVVHVVVDKTRSMDLFTNSADELIEQLKQHVEVEVTTIDTAERSAIGDAVLGQVRPFESILLFSDGNANEGAEIGDVGVYAKNLNSTIHRVSLDAIRSDISVSISGPQKVLEGTDNEFYIRLGRVNDNTPVHLQVTINGQTVYDETTSESAIRLNERLIEGYHEITARITHNDHFSENNVFYKTVKSVARPSILYVSQDPVSPLDTLLRQQYTVTTTPTLDSNSIEPYYAVILNNIDAPSLTNTVDDLTSFVAEGNGLLAVGGRNSYNYGAYKHSQFETLLPVQTGRAGRQEGDISVIVVIDISGSTASTVDIEKSLALNVINDLDLHHSIGVVAFNTDAFIVSPLSVKASKLEVEERVARLQDGGGTNIHAGILQALDMLANAPGSKNIVLISDGRTQGTQNTLEATKLASNQGVRIYTIGVGESTNDELMTTIADITTGIYFKASESNRLRILFGDLEAERDKDVQDIIVLNANHFITSNIGPLNAQISGWNEAVPKTTANMLVTTGAGDPLVTIWRFGLGRTAALTTDDGSQWAGPLLNRDNSKLLLRTVNWIIGEPDRKEDNTVTIADGRIGQPTDLLLRSTAPPVAQGYTFYKLDDTTYQSSIISQQLGYSQVLGATFATNYPSELQFLGENSNLDRVVYGTGGDVFEPHQIDEIVERTRSRASRSVTAQEPIRYPFIIAAILLFLIEVAVRRLLRKE